PQSCTRPHRQRDFRGSFLLFIIFCYYVAASCTAQKNSAVSAGLATEARCSRGKGVTCLSILQVYSRYPPGTFWSACVSASASVPTPVHQEQKPGATRITWH